MSGTRERVSGTPSRSISVVVPAYNEEQNLLPLYRAVAAALEPLALSWELVIADDGSSDGSWRTICALHEEDERVRGIRLSRNFGHQYALFAGLSHASGEAVVSMDADLQHPPELIPQLVDEWEKGSKIVHTVRLDAQRTPLFKRITSRIFYRVYSALSGSRVDPGMADFRLLDRRVLDELLHFREEGLFLRGLVQWVGYPTSKVEFESGERLTGKTKYPLSKMLKFAWTGVTSFSIAPLRMAVLLGVATSLVSFAGIVYAVGSFLLGLPTVPGWASVLSILSFLFGVLFILLGIIGEYVGKILLEVKRRPRYLVDETIGIPQSGQGRTRQEGDRTARSRRRRRRSTVPVERGS